LFDLTPLFAALLVIGLAELGDKTQLLTFGFATRYPFWQVMAAVAAATGLLMALAVLFGGVVNRFIPDFYVQLLAGLLFILFGLLILLGKEEEKEKEKEEGGNPFGIVFAAFFLAELGDKTQLATLTLSAKYGAPLLVWLGATLAMIGVNTVSVLAGGWTRKFIPESWLKFVGAAVFIIFGLWTLGELFLW
jgi:putative Ca2+/H+ antiporter (TMEM165/GDT1 family)